MYRSLDELFGNFLYGSLFTLSGPNVRCFVVIQKDMRRQELPWITLFMVCDWMAFSLRVINNQLESSLATVFDFSAENRTGNTQLGKISTMSMYGVECVEFPSLDNNS